MGIFPSKAYDNPYEENVWHRISKSLLLQKVAFSHTLQEQRCLTCMCLSMWGKHKGDDCKAGESQTITQLERPRASKCPQLLLRPLVQDPDSLHPIFWNGVDRQKLMTFNKMFIDMHQVQCRKCGLASKEVEGCSAGQVAPGSPLALAPIPQTSSATWDIDGLTSPWQGRARHDLFWVSAAYDRIRNATRGGLCQGTLLPGEGEKSWPTALYPGTSSRYPRVRLLCIDTARDKCTQ